MNYIGYIPAVYHGLKCVAHHVMRLPKEDKNGEPIQVLANLPEMQGILVASPQVRGDTKLVLVDALGEIVPFGSNRKNFSGNSVCIRVHRAFFTHEPAGTRFFVRKAVHELTNEVPYLSELLKSIATLAAAALCQVEQTFLGYTMRFTTLGIAELCVEKFYVARQVAAATQFALERSTKEELLGALNIMDAVERFQKSDNKSSLRLAIEERLERMHNNAVKINHDVSNKIFAALKK